MPDAETILAWLEADPVLFVEHRHGSFRIRRGNTYLSGYHRKLRAAIAEAMSTSGVQASDHQPK